MKGFTLIETVITIAIFVFIMAAIATLYFFYMRAFGFEQATINTGVGVSMLMDAERTAALQADAIVSSHAFSGTTYYSSATTTVFELPSIQSTGAAITGSHDYIVIYVSGTSASRVSDIAAGSARVSPKVLLTNTMSAINITYNNATISLATSTTVDATTSASYRGITTSTHLNEVFYLRNSN